MPPRVPPPAPSGDSGRSDARRNRQALLEVSAEVLAEDPSASMERIAERAGLGRATVYRHVAGRAELVQEVAESALQSAAEAVRSAVPEEGAAPDALLRLLTALVREGEQHRSLLLLGIARDPAFLAARARVLAPILTLVRRGIDEGELRRDLDPEWALSAMLALLQTAVAEGRADAVETVWTTLMNGWGPPDHLK